MSRNLSTRKAITTSEQMATSPRLHLSLLLSVLLPGSGLPLGPGALGAGPEDSPPSCHWPGLAFGQRPRSQLCVHPGLGRRGRAGRKVASARIPSLISPLLGPWGRGRTASPCTNLPVGEGKRGARCQEPAASDLRPNSSPILSCPLVLDPPPQCGGLNPLRVPPLLPFFLLPMFTSTLASIPIPSIRL